MDIETIKRVKGDFNLTSMIMKMNSFQQEQQGTNQSYLKTEDQTERTFSLTILFNNIIDVNLKEIIALYDQIDKKLFDHQIGRHIIVAERSKFDDVSQLENQRIVLHQYKNSLVYAAQIIQTEQLVVVKQIKVDNCESFIQYLDEYKIHYKINQLFPQQSLELIPPVRIEKGQNFYEIAACMERAQFNLYDYSRNHQIGDDEAINIFVQILDQIINLHSVNIAHRDVKPQNIFYVKEKGWLLSDFGESLEYEEVDGLYNIRGTKYFLLPALQSSINKNGKFNQNLITNDTYALVVCMIMIKNQQYIYDMKDQIDNLKDDWFKQAIKLSNLPELIEYRAKIQFNKNKGLINLNKPCLQEMSADEMSLNNKLNFLSQMQYFMYQIYTHKDPIWIQQILQLIKKNVKFILEKFDSILAFNLMNLCLSKKIDFQVQLNRKMIKILRNKPLNQQEFYLQLSFIYGYTEITINFATEYLQLNYSQSVHLTLIDSYYRANMVYEAEQQLKLFHEGMVFDQLNTSSQNKYLQYLQFLNSEQQKYNVQFEFNIELELIDRGFKQSEEFMNDFYNKQQQFLIDQYQNRNKIVNSIINCIDEMCNDFSVLNIYFCHQMFLFALDQPLYVLLALLQNIYSQNYGQFDTNKKYTFLQQIAEIFIMINQRKEFMQNLKLMKKSFFYSESWEQTISFKIIYQTTLFMEHIFQDDTCKFNINHFIRKFVNELKKITQIKFKCYFQYILGSLLNLIQIIKIYKMHHKSKYILYILEYIINLAFKHNLHISKFDNYQQVLIQAQCILIELKNDNRCQHLVQQQRKQLNQNAQQVIIFKKIYPSNILIKPSIKILIKIQSQRIYQINQLVTSEFQYNRYFE